MCNLELQDDRLSILQWHVNGRTIFTIQNVILDFVENLNCLIFRILIYAFNQSFMTWLLHSQVKQYLVKEFENQIIGYGGFEEWLLRSPGLTPPDFFRWGYLKQQIYPTPWQTWRRCERVICASTCATWNSNKYTDVHCNWRGRVLTYQIKGFFWDFLFHHNVGNCEKTNTRFIRSVLSINVHKMSFRSKSMTL